MRIEAGKYYRTRDGRKVGPITFRGNLAGAPGFGLGTWYVNDGYAGRASTIAETKDDLVAEWIDEAADAAEAQITPTNDNGPIRTRRVIVPGVYGIVRVFKDGAVFVDAMPAPSPASLRKAAHLFNQIAEVLEEQAGQANAA